MKIHVFESREALALAVVERFAAVLERARAGVRAPVFGLATGSSPRGIYDELTRLADAGQLDFSRAHVFHLDEYCGLAPAHPMSFHRAVATLATRLGVPKDRQHLLTGNGARATVARRAASYEAAIRTAGGIDLQLLGVGRDGHIGFNEPGSTPEARTRLVALTPMTRQDAADDLGGLEHVPHEALTLGVGTILEAKELALVALGKGKAAIVHAMAEGPISSAVPASFVRLHNQAALYLDTAAATLLTSHQLPAAG